MADLPLRLPPAMNQNLAPHVVGPAIPFNEPDHQNVIAPNAPPQGVPVV
jgi:hypothetical protein